MSTGVVRADKVFFQVQFDSPVQDIIFDGSGNLSRTRVPQVVGIFDEDFRLDPGSNSIEHFLARVGAGKMDLE